MATIDINDFNQEKECLYSGEKYSVRDNGAVYRHRRNNKRRRPNDEKWTFGKENTTNPYLHISNVRIHRIIATAFHGEPPGPNYVVDHIDSNCRNNRPENLRWLTRLENALKNPVTRKKIEYLCGSIEEFLKNPSMLNDLQGESNFNWMRRVTKEEAQNCLERMSLWTKTKKGKETITNKLYNKNSFMERALQPLQKWEAGLVGEPGLDFAATPWCAQYLWRATVYFPCCPESIEEEPLENYFKNLKPGKLFAYEEGNKIPNLLVQKSKLLKSKSSILVLCKREDSNWSIVGITLNDRYHFIHFNLGSFHSRSDSEEAFTRCQSLEDFWSEGFEKSWDPQ